MVHLEGCDSVAPQEQDIINQGKAQTSLTLDQDLDLEGNIRL